MVKPMSVHGQKRRFDRRAGHFRSTPINGHRQTTPECLKSATSRHCPPFEWHTSTDQASTRLIGPRNSILPTLTPLWRRMA
jgi:hypothetical protein